MKDYGNRINQLETEVETIKQVIVDELTSRDFMLPEEVAEMLGLKLTTIYRKVQNGTIPYYKDGKKIYFSRKAVINNLKSIK